ncbi:MAG: peptide ABC transporter substrate-binding protein [Ruminococcaceae bacterium]|nr:peptide ABC transporter substrate-binding protein [Oscillospiraceae bacterium]
MKRILAFTLCLVMLVPLFAGCGKKDENDKGAIIRAYMTSDIYNFDPIYAYTDDATTKIMGMVYEGLFRLNKDNKVEKALCKDYRIIEDKQNGEYKIEITINKTSWSDGREVSVDDVIFAWKRILDPEFSCSIAPMLYDIKNAKKYKSGDCSPDDVGLYAVDTKVMEIQFEKAIDYDAFIETLCSPLLVPLREDILSKAEKWASNVAIMVSNGPFSVRSFKPGEKVALQRNPYYYRDIEKDAEDKVVKPYRIYVDLSATPEEQIEAYNAGELFYISEIPLEFRQDMKSKVKVVDMQSVHTYYFNTNNELFKDAKVRQALSMALDRQKIAEIAVFAKPATGLITDGVFNTSRKNSFREEGGDLIKTSADVQAAKKLLNEAGVKKGSFTITIRNNEVDEAIAKYAEGVWEGLGFKVDIKKLGSKKTLTENEYEVYIDQFEEAFEAGEFDVAAIDLQMFSTDAFSTLAGFASNGYSGTALDLSDKEGGGWDLKPSVTGYDSDKYNKAIDNAFAEKSDREKRAGYLHEAEKILLQDMPVMPLVTLQNAYAADKKLSKFSFDFYGCSNFTDAKFKNYELYTDMEDKADEAK